MLPPACSIKVLRWNKSGYAKPNIPCWYQMGPRNVLHSMVKIWAEIVAMYRATMWFRLPYHPVQSDTDTAKKTSSE